LAKPDAWEQNIRETVEEDMGVIEKELREVGFQVRTMVKTGVPLREILETEQRENVSLIVIGSHGKSNLEEVLLGSVSEKLIRKCAKPILVIKR
jgi:nucleotide-binding universal stress UspA family protein